MSLTCSRATAADVTSPACSRRVNASAGSFHARQSSTLGSMERMRFTMARSVATDEAKRTCEAAAAADKEGPASRQPIKAAYVVTAPPEVAGEWRLVNNSRGEKPAKAKCINTPRAHCFL